jgi:replicative DNA helicase
MLRPEALPEIMDILRPEAFYSNKHRLIFTAMTKLYENKTNRSPYTFFKIKRSGRFG